MPLSLAPKVLSNTATLGQLYRTYQSNLRLLLSTLATNGSLSGFLKISEGQVPNQVYGLILCRGDLNATECRSCLDSATQEIQQVCLYNKGAMISYEQCVLRFSNQQFLSSIDETHQISTYNRDDAPQLERFNKLLHLLLNSTADWTVNSAKKFATGEVSNFTSEFPTIYSLMQCVPDMSRSDCRQCLWELFNPLPEQFVGKQGGRVLGMRCEMRFELYPFFRLPPTLKLTVPAEHAAEPGQPFLGAGRKNRTGTVLAIVIPAMALISITAICYMVKRKPIIKYPYEIDPDHILNVETLQFDLSTLRVATANFSEGNKLGEGGFGAVYKGLLPNGREIAVKRLLNSGQGLREMKNELVLLAKLQHGNLVKLVGVCLGEEKMVVYEYVPNRSLDTFLFDPARGEQLGWETRYNIINGIARGLLYLHEESQLKIIHRDLKASNILLDADMKPKISDFGLAKLFDGGQTQGNTNRVVGTFGYMAPEYVMHGKFSIKSDVFSFGILVLEILTGRRNTGSYNSEVAQDLLSYTWEKWNEGTSLEIVDPALGAQYKGSDILRCIQIGLLCVQESPSDRPTMSTIVVLLNAETVSLQAPSRPAFYVGRSSSSSILVANNPRSQNGRHDRESKPLPTSPNEVSISVLEPR